MSYKTYIDGMCKSCTLWIQLCVVKLYSIGRLEIDIVVYKFPVRLCMYVLYGFCIGAARSDVSCS